MGNYARFVGAVCLLGCSNAETPASTQSGAMTGAGTSAPVAAVQPASASGAGAGRSAQISTPAAIGGSPATPVAPSATAGTGSSAIGIAGSTATAGAGNAAGATTTASAGSSAAGSGSAGPAASGGGGSGGAIAPTFANVYSSVLINMCPSCHVMGGVIGSPDLSSMEAAYSSLVDKDATTAMTGVCGGKGKLVSPGDCDKSLLYNKLSQATPACGRRMPLSSMTIPQAGLDLLCAWIKAGAKNN